MVTRALLDLLLPPRCPVCGRPSTAVWCGLCLAELAGLALPAGGDELLAPQVRAVGAYHYEGVVRDTILAVKMSGRHAALEGMGAMMRARLGLPPPGPGIAVTWVPTDRTRIRRRGVDVPRILAGAGATALLRRVRTTRDQTELSATERRRNPMGAFAPLRPAPPAVVLIDDVRTTGATACAAASALLAGGARRVLVATFAVAGAGMPVQTDADATSSAALSVSPSA